MTREQNRQKMFDYMLHKGVDRFWANSALKHIMLSFAGNAHWLTDIREPKVIVGAGGTVDKFTVNCTINTESGNTNGRLTYTFGRGHKVRIKAIK